MKIKLLNKTIIKTSCKIREADVAIAAPCTPIPLKFAIKFGSIKNGFIKQFVLKVITEIHTAKPARPVSRKVVIKAMLIANNGYDKATILKYSAPSNVEIDAALYSKYLNH